MAAALTESECLLPSVWQELKAQTFRDKLQLKELTFVPILIDFSRLLSSHVTLVKKVNKKDLLFAIIVLFGRSLKAMESEELHSVLTKKSVKTLLLIKQPMGKSSKLEPISGEFQPQPRTVCAVPEADSSSMLLPNSANEDHLQCSGNAKGQEVLGEFDGIFSDCSSTEEETASESEEEDDFISEFNQFIKRIRSCKEEQAIIEENVENLVIAAATFDRSYSLPQETVCHLLLVAVRKKYRNCGIGKFMINMMKDPLIVGPYDLLFTYAEQNAVAFFKQHGFTDDSILASRYSKVSDNWLNSIPMCYIPSFSSSSLTGCQNAAIPDISVIEEKMNKWKNLQVDAYQSQMNCVLRLTQQLKSFKETVEQQDKIIDRLKNENILLHRKLYSSNQKSDIDINIEDENRAQWEFCQQLLIEKSIIDVEVTSFKKASVSRSNFECRLATLKDPLIYDDLYYCGGKSKEDLERILENGFSETDLSDNKFGKGLYFSQSPKNAMDFTEPGLMLLCTVGLGNTQSILKGSHSRDCAPEGYDSILTTGRRIPGSVNHTGHEYIIHDIHQTLPLCLIEYHVQWL